MCWIFVAIALFVGSVNCNRQGIILASAHQPRANAHSKAVSYAAHNRPSKYVESLRRANHLPSDISFRQKAAYLLTTRCGQAGPVKAIAGNELPDENDMPTTDTDENNSLATTYPAEDQCKAFWESVKFVGGVMVIDNERFSDIVVPCSMLIYDMPRKKYHWKLEPENTCLELQIVILNSDISNTLHFCA